MPTRATIALIVACLAVTVPALKAELDANPGNDPDWGFVLTGLGAVIGAGQYDRRGAKKKAKKPEPKP